MKTQSKTKTLTAVKFGAKNVISQPINIDVAAWYNFSEIHPFEVPHGKRDFSKNHRTGKIFFGCLITGGTLKLII